MLETVTRQWLIEVVTSSEDSLGCSALCSVTLLVIPSYKFAVNPIATNQNPVYSHSRHVAIYLIKWNTVKDNRTLAHSKKCKVLLNWTRCDRQAGSCTAWCRAAPLLCEVCHSSMDGWIQLSELTDIAGAFRWLSACVDDFCYRRIRACRDLKAGS
jgi:hypothetical protein